MRERREVAARADRAAARHERVHAAVEQLDEALERGAANAGEALGEHVRAQRHRRAHRAHRQRLADAGRMAAQQIELQRAERAARNRRLRQRAEAGVDAVDRRRRPRPCDRRRRATASTRARGGRREPDRRALVRDRDELGRASGSRRRGESSKKVEYCSYEHRGARRAVGRRGQGQDRRSAHAEFFDRRPLPGRPQRRPHGVRQRTQVRAAAAAVGHPARGHHLRHRQRRGRRSAGALRGDRRDRAARASRSATA